VPHTVAFGLTRTVATNTPMVSFEGGQYSVPHPLLGETVWVPTHGLGSSEQVIICHVGDSGPVEVARHARARPGSPKLSDAHFPPAPAGALNRAPRAKNAGELEFLALGDGARLWLTEAAAAGTGRMRVKMAEAVALGKLLGVTEVDWALGHAAVNSRFGESDLASILQHQARTRGGELHRVGEDRSLTQGTSGWAALGVSNDRSTTGTGEDEVIA
jgi:hypothetical protein